MDAQSNLSGAHYRTLDAAAVGRFSSANDCRRSNRTNRHLASKAIITYGFVTDEEEKLLGGYRDARPATGAKQSARGGNHARESVLSHTGHVSDRSDEIRAGAALPGLSGL